MFEWFHPIIPLKTGGQAGNITCQTLSTPQNSFTGILEQYCLLDLKTLIDIGDADNTSVMKSVGVYAVNAHADNIARCDVASKCCYSG